MVIGAALGPLALLLGGFVVFLVQGALHGPLRTPRLDRLAASPLLPRACLEYGYVLYRGPAWLCLRLGITPDMLTYASLALVALGAILVGAGSLVAGGWMLLGGFTCDALDGVVARALGTGSDRGELLDAVVDHYADHLTYAGFAWYYRTDPVPLALAAGAMFGSALVTYSRAKGASLGVDVAGGWMRRFERTVWLGGGTVLAPVVAALVEPGATHPRYHLVIVVLAVLCALTHATALWRITRVRAVLQERAAHAG